MPHVLLRRPLSLFIMLLTLGVGPLGGRELPEETGCVQNTELRFVPAPGQVTIDGDLKDWDGSGQIFMCSDLRQRLRQSAFVRGMYDQQALYLALTVNDPTPLRNPVDPAKRPDRGWEGDCLQLRFRVTDPAGGERILFVDSWYHHPRQQAVTLVQPRQPRAAPRKLPHAAAFRLVREGATYVQELRLPWAELGITPEQVEAGFTWRLGIEVVGGPHGNEKESFRLVDLVAQHGTFTTLFFAHPERWGQARLVAEGKLRPAQYQTMPVETSEHPFLLCTREQFPELRARAEREPWQSMKADAIATADKGLPKLEPGQRTRLRGAQMTRYVGAVALAYIVDEERQGVHRDRLYEAITNHLAEVEFDPAKKWEGTVPALGAAWLCIIALDLIHDDLTAKQREACEAAIEGQLAKLSRRGAWAAARFGTFGTWDIYRGDRIVPDDEFYANYVRQMTPDGVSTVSPGYAFARLGSGDGRPQKTGYADILEFTGIDRRYYSNERLQRFYRWLFSASVTPAKEFHQFGDVAPQWGPQSNSALAWRVGLFDREAAAYAAWLNQGKEPPGHFLTYVLMTEPLPEPKLPRSQLFMDGEAVFREVADSPLSLGAALYSISCCAEWHTHEEANAISLAAYGARLTVNGGWLGDEMAQAPHNNTICVDGQRHQSKVGGGLTEGLLGQGFDYACAGSGKALGDDQFRRSLLFVHGQDGCGGYFAVLDEVTADPGEKVHQYFQLAAEREARALAERERYQVAIDHHTKVEGVQYQVLYAVEPESVAQARIPSGFLERQPSSGHHYRLEAVFPTDARGQRRLATVFFPYDAEHPAAKLERLTGEGLDGARIRFADGSTDTLYVADPAATHGVTLHEQVGLRFQARAALVRCNAAGQVHFLFARQGTRLVAGDRGFESDAPISLHLRRRDGVVTSAKGARVSLVAPGFAKLRLDGEPVEVRTEEAGVLMFDLPAGTHKIELVE